MVESIGLAMGRTIFALLDFVVYNVLGYFYEIMTEIPKVMIVSADQSNEFATKIYTLLGIFMLFKITFSLINYIVNPETINDKNKGVGKIAVNIVIVLVLIIITPTVFSKLYQLQNAILADDIIPKFILGSAEETSLGKNQLYMSEEFCGTGEENAITASSDGQYIALMMFRTFYQPEKERYSDSSDFLDEKIGTDYCNVENNSTSDFLKDKIYNSAEGVNSMYSISYSLLISTAVGIFVALLFLSFSIDIAVRSIKLSFLQIISPIPIISYLDPESGKKGMFAKWLKDVGKTWADLFIRLIAIYFAVYIIGIMGSNGFALKDFNGNELVLNHSLMVPLFIMIGALVFAKRLPSIITDLTGIKLGGLQLNPFKKVEKEALLGKAASGLGFAAAALPANLGALAYNKTQGKSWKGSLDEFKKGNKAAFSSPGTMKGYTAGIKPIQDETKKKRDAKYLAEQKLSENKKMLETGAKLFDQSADVLTDGQPTNDAKTGRNKKDFSTIFDDDNYRNSYVNLRDAKDYKKSLDKKLVNENAALSRLTQEAAMEQDPAKKANIEKLLNEKTDYISKLNGQIIGTTAQVDRLKAEHKLLQDTNPSKDYDKEKAIELYENELARAKNVQNMKDDQKK